jgi:Ion channel
MSIISAYLRLVARWRWSFLLALLIGSFVLQALLPETAFTRFTGFTLFMLIFGGALYAGRTSPRATRGAVALLLAALGLQFLTFLGVANLEGPLTVLALMIVLGALVATFTELVGNREATADSLVGAIFGFFVIAAACALLFRQLEGAHPGSFRLPEGGDLDTQMLYFSLVTVTTAGYGDITPATSVAQISAALEAALGTLYIAILIGRIVGQLAPRLGPSAAVPPERAPGDAGTGSGPGGKRAGVRKGAGPRGARGLEGSAPRTPGQARYGPNAASTAR